MAPRRPRYHLIDLLLVIALCGILAAVVRWVGSLASQVRRLAPLEGGFLTTFIGFEVAFITWFILWKSIRAKRNAPECQDCGRRFVSPKKSIGPAVCPQCRQRSLSPIQLKKEQAKNIRTLVICLVILTSLLGFLLSGYVGSQFQRGYWIALTLISIGALLGSIGLVILALLVVMKIRFGLLKKERFALARARKIAGCEGEVVRSGPVTVWYSGPTDPVPMLMEQWETVRCRFEVMLGEEFECRAPLRILRFLERDDFVAYFRQTRTNLWNLDGLYAPCPWWTITLSTEVVPYRLADSERTARSLFGFYVLEAYKGFFPRPWLQQGLANALACDDDELARLNRKMVASLARGTALGADLFRLESRAVVKLVRSWYDHGQFSKLAQFNAQSWSLVEYLGGVRASEERRDQFWAFLKEIQPREPDEAVFERRFGHGFDSLLEDWKAWVLARGVGTAEPPLPRVQEALLERVIPIVRNRQAKVMDRIQAIRDLGRAGHVLGADALIDLVRDPGEIPKEEVIWSLEVISGLVLGDDPDRWRTWFSELPREVIGETADSSPNPVP